MHEVLERLLVGGGFFSGTLASSQIGVSRTAVSKQVERLRRLGYNIESVRGKGYRLVPRFDGLLPLEVKSKLRTRLLGREVTLLEITDSTQSYLRRLADSGAREGAVVVALSQTSGRGRASRSWSSPPGGLWFSLLLRPKVQLQEAPPLTLLFGVAVARSLAEIGVPACLKWPNDVLVGGRKVCGILLETSSDQERVEYVVAGVGVNTNFCSSALPEHLRNSATSLMELLGKKVDRATLLSSILFHAELMYERYPGTIPEILDAWRSFSCTLGRDVRVESGGRIVEGRAVGIDPDGSLVVETTSGKERVYSGEVLIR